MSDVPERRADEIHSGGKGPAPGRFLPGMLALLLASLSLSAVLVTAFEAGFYMSVLIALILAVPLGVAVFGFVWWTHLRWPLLAGGIGLLAGAVAYLGQYHLWFVWQFGSELWHRIDTLPDIIHLRMLTDSSTSSATPAAEADVSPVENWVFFGLELMFMAGAGGLVGFLAAKRPWCGRCGRWAERTVVALPRDLADGIATAEDDALLEGLAECGPFARPVSPGDRQYVAVALEKCPSPACGTAALSIRRIGFGGGIGQMQTYDMALGNQLRPRRPLTPADLRQLAPMFGDQALAEEAPNESPAVSPTGAAATIDELHGANANRIMTVGGSFRVMVSELGLAAVGFAGFLGGLALLAATEEEQGVPAWQWAWRLAIMIAGFVSMLAWLGVTIFRANTFGNRFIRRRLFEMIERRPDALVRPGDEGARLVELVPLEKINKLQLDDADDVGLLRFDADRGALLFEGDRTRRVIPVEAIDDVVYHAHTEVQSQFHSSVRHLCVLVLQTPEGQRRWPFALREPWVKGADRLNFVETLMGLLYEAGATMRVHESEGEPDEQPGPAARGG